LTGTVRGEGCFGLHIAEKYKLYIYSTYTLGGAGDALIVYECDITDPRRE